MDQDHDRRRRHRGTDRGDLVRRAGRAGAAAARPTRSSAAAPAASPAPTRRISVRTRCWPSSPFWKWLGERDLLPPDARPPLSGVRFRWRDDIRRVPAVGAAVAALRLRGRTAPVELDFRTWASDHVGAEAADGAGAQRRHPHLLPRPRRAVGRVSVGAARARAAVGAADGALPDRRLERDHRADARARARARRRDPDRRAGRELPEAPVIVATELDDARRLLGDDTLRWLSGHAVCLDLALRSRRGDPFVVVDLQETGWVERYTAADRSLAPGRRGADPGADADPPGRDRRRGRRATRAAARRVVRRLARARDVAPAPGDGRAHRRAGPARTDVARPARRSTAATACSWPATWSRPPAACRRSRGRARSRRAAWPGRARARESRRAQAAA